MLYTASYSIPKSGAIQFKRKSSLLIPIKYVIMSMLSYRYLATGGGVLYGIRDFFFYRCHGWCGQPPHQQMVRQQRFIGQQITYWVLCQYKSKEGSPDCAATRFGDFICCPHGLIITFLAYWHYSICKIDFQYVFISGSK